MSWFWVDNNEYQAIGRRLDTITTKLAALVEQGKRIMSKQTELEAAIADLSATIAKVATDIENQLAIVTAGTSDAAVEAAITQIASLTATLKQKATDLEADDPVG